MVRKEGRSGTHASLGCCRTLWRSTASQPIIFPSRLHSFLHQQRHRRGQREPSRRRLSMFPCNQANHQQRAVGRASECSTGVGRTPRYRQLGDNPRHPPARSPFLPLLRRAHDTGPTYHGLLANHQGNMQCYTPASTSLVRRVDKTSRHAPRKPPFPILSRWTRDSRPSND